MKTLDSIRLTFSAAHQIPKSQICGVRLHGHDFYVVVAANAKIENDKVRLIADLLDELHLRNLNDMIVGAESDNEGIAGWLLERLRLHIPGLRFVMVGFQGQQGIVEV